MKLLCTMLLCLSVVRAARGASKSPDFEEKIKEFQDQEAGGLGPAAAQELRDKITAFLGTLQEPWLPYVPLLSFDTLSLALTEVSVSGLADVEVGRPILGLTKFTLDLLFPALTLYSGHYIMGGKIIDLITIGESTANITLQNFAVDVSLELEHIRCAVRNSTTLNLAAEDILVNFANLNPEYDEQGVLINSMLENVASDILKWLSQELSAGGDLSAKYDEAIVEFINHATGCRRGAEKTSVEDDFLELEFDLKNNNAIGALQFLADYLGRVLNVGSFEDTFLGQIQYSLHSHAEEMAGKW